MWRAGRTRGARGIAIGCRRIWRGGGSCIAADRARGCIRHHRCSLTAAPVPADGGGAQRHERRCHPSRNTHRGGIRIADMWRAGRTRGARGIAIGCRRIWRGGGSCIAADRARGCIRHHRCSLTAAPVPADGGGAQRHERRCHPSRNTHRGGIRIADMWRAGRTRGARGIAIGCRRIWRGGGSGWSPES